MENTVGDLSQILKSILLLKSLIVKKIGDNPYGEIDKILLIVNQKNYKQYRSIRLKVKELTILLYDRRVYDKDIENVLNIIESFLNEYDSSYSK